MAMNTNRAQLSVVGGNSLVPGQNQAAVGRRLDQVQTRRRRMKNARSMKVLYHYLEGIYNYAQEDPQRDTSMEFDNSYQKGLANG